MIPLGWTESELGELATFKSGGTPSKTNDAFWGGDFPWVSAKDLKSHLISKAELGLTPAGAALANVALPDAVLVLVRGMTLLKDVPIGFVTKPVAFNQDIKALIASPKVSPLFLSYLLVERKQSIRALVNTANHGTGRLDTDLLKGLPVLVPPLPEQRIIAEMLATWDRTIETVEALIANARAQKQALMQQLFSAQIRLPGFSERWAATTLDQVAKVIVSNVDKKSVASENPVRLCNYMDVYRSDRIEADMDFMAATATTDQTRKFGLRVGDVLITKDSETPEDIAIPAYVASTAPDLVCGYHLAIIRPKMGCDGQFLKYYFEHPHTRYFFATRANGATRFGLTIDAIETAPITLPDYEEQQRIAAVIAAAEQEIDRLKPIAAALREEKSALMQQLLTGKRRVKLNEKEHA
jgi:type I restriction enzyme, S subunit